MTYHRGWRLMTREHYLDMHCHDGAAVYVVRSGGGENDWFGYY